MLKKFLLICLATIFVLLNLFTITCNAKSIEITKENLNSTFQKMTSLNEQGTTKFTVNDKTIDIVMDNKAYSINYDLSEKPTFTVEISVKDGMTYEEYSEQSSNLFLPVLGYVAVANLQDVDFEDSIYYFLTSYMSNALNNPDISKNNYTILDDSKLDAGTKLEDNVISTSKFPEEVMKYVNSMYKNKLTIKDSSKDDINSYEYVLEMQDLTDTSCKIVSKLVVNTDADFSKIKGKADQLGENIKDWSEEFKKQLNNSANSNSNSNNNNNNNNNNQNAQANNIANVDVLPKTGNHPNVLKNVLYVIIGFCVLSVIVISRKIIKK